MISPSVFFHEPKLFLLTYMFFSQKNPLIYTLLTGHLEICHVLVASKADVAARHRCRSPWRARNLPLTPCVAAAAKCAIDYSKADVAAYLRSIGAPQ